MICKPTHTIKHMRTAAHNNLQFYLGTISAPACRLANSEPVQTPLGYKQVAAGPHPERLRDAESAHAGVVVQQRVAAARHAKPPTVS